MVASPPCELVRQGNPPGYEHSPIPGMTRQHTRNGSPARYFGDEQAIRAIEDETARRAPLVRGAFPGKTEYLRSVGEVIGWDDGDDATLSYVECIGSAGCRSRHGRPIREGNPKTRLAWTTRGPS